ncbi:MAG TPA: cyclopropane fatty acyl phospholipid synthase [Opitutales bacterium]|nr:cyclopropane fatty acyl phospholipid synthase [Opitutales bacterium]
MLPTSQNIHADSSTSSTLREGAGDRKPAPGHESIESLLAEADITIGGNRPWDIRVRDERFYRRVLAEPSLGLGEAYVEGWWDVERLDEFFHRVLREELHRRNGTRPGLLWDWALAKLVNQQSLRRSQRVAERHYDLGNEFFERMLDPHMQYTCGYWKDADNLAAAQEAKLDLICRKLALRPGDSILEFGGGWGGFAKFAAERYGCRVTVYNISREQVRHAREWCRDLPVEVHHADYRMAEGSYDRVVSIGMCEHVGARNYGELFRIKRRCLKEDGLMFLHTIGCNRTKPTSDPWIRRYIFPGGQLPSLRQLTDASEGIFTLEDLHNIGADYDPTLMAWHGNFERHWPEFRKKLGGSFQRMWRYYLLSCAGAFRARKIHLWQMVFAPRGLEGGYVPVR